MYKKTTQEYDNDPGKTSITKIMLQVLAINNSVYNEQKYTYISKNKFSSINEYTTLIISIISTKYSTITFIAVTIPYHFTALPEKNVHMTAVRCHTCKIDS